MNSPLISVVIPVYNGEAFLNESIKSILNQTFKNFEFIIINDGSTDKSEKIIKSFQKQDDRIVLINQKNQGITKSLNTGIRLSKGKYIARMDSDDVAEIDRFKDQIQYLEHNKDLDIVGCQISFIDSQSKKISHKIELPIDDLLIKWELIFGTPLFHPTLMIRKSVFEKFGYFNPISKYAQDLEFWRKIANNVKFGNLPDTLVKIRKSEILSDTDKLKIQSSIRYSSLIQYLKSISGLDYNLSESHEISRFFISGKPIFSNFPQFLEKMMIIKNGFIKKNCKSSRESILINKRVSLLFLRSLSMNKYPMKTYFLITKHLFTLFPFLILNKTFWNQLLISKPKMVKV